MLKNLINRLERLNYLIHLKATGSPKQLSQRLGISERSLYEYISLLKEIGAPIKYDKPRRTYFYEEDFTLSLHFQD